MITYGKLRYAITSYHKLSLLMIMKERERRREGDTERKTEGEKERNRQREGERDRTIPREKERNREREKERNREREKERNREREKETKRGPWCTSENLLILSKLGLLRLPSREPRQNPNPQRLMVPGPSWFIANGTTSAASDHAESPDEDEAQLFAGMPEERAAWDRISQVPGSTDKNAQLEEFCALLQLRADGMTLSYQAMFVGFGATQFTFSRFGPSHHNEQWTMNKDGKETKSILHFLTLNSCLSLVVSPSFVFF